MREQYADAVLKAGGVKCERLRAALARVPRERFLPPGPWWVPAPAADPSFAARYELTEDADLRHVYRNTAIALDRNKDLANGTPSYVARWLAAAQIAPGDHVFQFGAGTGYYTAIIAELVGPTGSVLAVECEPELAARAKAALAPWPQASVLGGDGLAVDPGDREVIFFNTGVSTILPIWLQRLKPGGRMVLPITSAFAGGSGLSKGPVFVFTRHPEGIAAKVNSVVVVYACRGMAEDLGERLWASMAGNGGADVRQLRTDRHDADGTCWLHGDGWCLSKLALEDRDGD